MASDLVVPVIELKKVRKHPNADKLELANALGYQICVPKDTFKSGDKVVYFPSDTIMDKEWIDKLNIGDFLKGKQKNRIGKIRLRGEPSFGLAIPMDNFDFKIGDNVAEFFKCKKWEPPLRITNSKEAKYNSNIDPYIESYTDIQNGRIFTDIFEDGEPVIATEKIHGTNCKIGYIDNYQIASSMSIRRAPPLKYTKGNKWLRLLKNWWFKRTCSHEDKMNLYKKNPYWFPWTIANVCRLILYLKLMKHKNVLVYGEVYGSPVQSFHYGMKNKFGFKVFDIKIDGKFLSWDEFKNICGTFNVEIAPVAYEGPFDEEKISKVAEGKTLLNDTHIREGVVVRPVEEKTHPKVGRVCLKYLSTEYSLLSNKTDYTDI